MDFLLSTWTNTCGPCLDPDSVLPAHQGGHSIPPFQTHSRYFYAPLGELCCGRRFVELLLLQHHPFPHCRDCARMVLAEASLLCWVCRTYFRRYGTGRMQQIMGVTPQRHNRIAVLVPERGEFQERLEPEVTAQQWRDTNLRELHRPLIQVLLPQPATCEFWILASEFLSQFGHHPCLVNLPTVPMPYHSPTALHPLPPFPAAGFLSGLSLQQEEREDEQLGESDSPPSE